MHQRKQNLHKCKILPRVKAIAQMHEVFMKGKISVNFSDPFLLMDFGLHNINVKATAQMHEAFLSDPFLLMNVGLYDINVK